MKLTHLDKNNRPVMVDVSGKKATMRTARASGRITLAPAMVQLVENDSGPKGGILNTAVVAGIQAVKKTDSLIPMCHSLQVDSVSIDFNLGRDYLECTCCVSAHAKTGFEMEALTGVSIALLTVYDMLKAIDKGMIIHSIRLLEKTGGKSGNYTAGAQ